MKSDNIFRRVFLVVTLGLLFSCASIITGIMKLFCKQQAAPN